jgi:curved DNA-binding protein
MSAAKPTLAEARALLGLSLVASPADVIAAFRAAAKVAHPDRPGGDADAFRQILAAYRVIQAEARLPTLALPSTHSLHTSPVLTPFVEVSPLVALRGGEAEAVLSSGQRITARIAPGARHGETLTIAGEAAQVRIRGDAEMQLRGSDLWVTAQVAALLLEAGGRANVETPLGPRVLWISRKIAERRLVRLEGQGLPAQGAHPQGSLFIRLAPDSGAPEGPARAQLRRFAAAWAA